MFRVTVEIVPGGREEQAQVLGIAHIANISELSDVSDYYVTLYEPNVPTRLLPAISIFDYKTATCKVYDHMRRNGWKTLVRSVFNRLAARGYPGAMT